MNGCGLRLLSSALLLCCSHLLADTKPPTHEPPRFTDYPVELKSNLPLPMASPKLKLGSNMAKEYRTVIRAEFTEPANFSGHYRVALWGCGTDCRNFAIIDKRHGSVYTLPGVNEISGVMGNDEQRVDFRLESKLLIVRGCLHDECLGDPTKAKQYYYLWTGKALQLIATRPLPLEAADIATPVAQ